MFIVKCPPRANRLPEVFERQVVLGRSVRHDGSRRKKREDDATTTVLYDSKEARDGVLRRRWLQALRRATTSSTNCWRHHPECEVGEQPNPLGGVSFRFSVKRFPWASAAGQIRYAGSRSVLRRCEHNAERKNSKLKTRQWTGLVF